MRTFAHRLVLSLTAALVLAAPASAAEVARIDGAKLTATDRARAGFCLQVTKSDPRSSGGSGTCGRAPWRARRSSLITMIDGSRLLAAGAVPAAITRAEAELADGRRVGFDTVAGPGYRGRHAGKLRFFLAALPLSDPSDEDSGGLVAVRFFGADGTLQGITGAERLGTPVGRSQLLLRERGGGRSTTVRGMTLRRVMPTPLQLDRIEESACLFVSTRTRYGEGGSTTLCHEAGPNRPDLLVFPESGCGPVRTVLSGFVGESVTAVRMQLGSGRMREVPARIFRDRQGREHRFVATAVPRGEAVRSISAVGADAGYDIGEPPSGLPCISDSGAFAISFLLSIDLRNEARPPGSGEQVAAATGSYRLLVRDAEDERLCAGVDRLRADGGDCAVPPVTADDAFAYADHGVISALLPAEVARVRLPDGREVTPIDGGGYTGRYAGAVRFLLVEADLRAEDRVRMLDSSGTVLGSLPVYGPELEAPEPDGPEARLAAGRGWRVTGAKDRYGSCLSVTLRGAEPACGTSLDGQEDGAFAAVGCSPRVAVLTGTLARRTRTVRVVLRGGRTLRPRIVRIPRRIGRGRAWALALPRGARVQALRFDDRRATFPLLPAADQCGYRVYGPALAQPELAIVR
jgi:hypothetical protein